MPLPIFVQSLIQQPTFARIRRNHGLEHATIHILSRKNPKRRVAGHSNAGGFRLFGDLSIEEIREATDEALSRLRAGEGDLAIHPNCGTNLVTSGILAGLAGALAMTGVGPRNRDRFERLPLAGLLATFALLFARPAGTRIQQLITTSANPEDLEILDIKPANRFNNLIVHRVLTRS